MAAQFEVYRDTQGAFRWRLKAANGEIVASGEAYRSKAGALQAIEGVKRAAAAAVVNDRT